MASDFKYIIFSIFDISDFNKVTDVVKLIFKRELEKGKAYIYPICPVIEEYINPQSGGSHFPKFSCWQVSHYPNKIFFISNSGDGRITLCNVLRLKLHCSFYQFALSNDNASPFFLFHHSSKQGITRDVLNYKEDRWQFYAKGPINSIEEIEFYKNRKIRERLNKEILLHYLKKMGISFWDIDKSVTDYFIVKRSV